MAFVERFKQVLGKFKIIFVDLRLLQVDFLLVLGVGNELHWFLAVEMAIEN